MMRVVWWRHGRTPWNLQGRFQGQSDIPLDEVGHQQAARAASYLQHLRPALIVSSDLQRAVQTAQPLSDLTGLPVLIDQRLRETHAGQWQGLTHHEIREQFGDALDQWSSGTDVRPGGGETRREVAQRVRTAVEDQLNGLNGLAEATVVVVTHGGAARAGMCSMLDLPETSWASLGVLANCSWSVMTRSSTQQAAPSWRLVDYNAGSLPEPVLGDDR